MNGLAYKGGDGGAPTINNDTSGCGDSARREEEQSTNTSQRAMARLDPARRETRGAGTLVNTTRDGKIRSSKKRRRECATTHQEGATRGAGTQGKTT